MKKIKSKLKKITKFERPDWNYKNLLLFLLGASVLALFLAYISQYVFGLQPCVLCLYQRKPFFIVIILALLVLLVPYFKNFKTLAIEISIIALFINALIGIYQVGVEKKFFRGPGSCAGITSNPTTLEELKTALKLAKPVRCDEPQFVFLKISMAGWNVFYCLMLVVIAVYGLRKIQKFPDV